MAVVHRLIRGPGAGKWLPWAQAKINDLVSIYGKDGVQSRRWTLDSGMVEIAARINRDQHYIDINARACPDAADGFFDIVNFVYPTVKVTVQEEEVDALRRFYPSPAERAASRDDDPTYVSDWQDEPRLNQSYLWFWLYRASEYSGEMRRVVQYLQGCNIIAGYSPLFSRTHGVYTATGKGKWIIDISSNGMYAYPMETCPRAVGSLDYTPIATPVLEGNDLTEALANGRAVQLLSALSLNPVYSRAPMFLICGWAFSASGHKCANVCYDQSGRYVNTFLFEITIVEEDDAPISASIEQVATGIWHGPRASVDVKYPDDQGGCYSFDPFYNDFGKVVSNAPVYTFYNEEERIDAFYIYNPFNTASQVYDELPLVCDPPPVSVMGKELRSGTYTITPLPCLKITGLVDETTRQIDSASLTTEAWKDLTLMGQNYAPTGGPTCFTTPCIWDVYRLTHINGSNVTVSDYGDRVLIVPVHEREAIFFGVHDVSSRLYGTYAVETWGVQIAPQYAVVNECMCAAAGAVNAVSVHIGNRRTETNLCPNFGPNANELKTSRSLTPTLDLSAALGAHQCYTTGIINQVAYQDASKTTDCLWAPGVGVAGLCAQVAGTSFQCVCATTIACDARTETNRHEQTEAFFVTLFGSGGLKITFTPKKSPLQWFLYADRSNDVVFTTLRDAFDAQKVLYSSEINTASGRDLVSTANDYPVGESGSLIGFVGVP